MPASDLLTRLLPVQRRGSKLRCHLLTHGDDTEVAARLTALVAPWAKVSPVHFWMPRGFKNTTEAKLGETPELLSDEHREQVLEWWLKIRPKANTPNWDIAGTCDIEGQTGLILVEAKAHSNELPAEGKQTPKTANGMKNHEQIGRAINEANMALNRIISGWHLSRDSQYQLSNRFAWAWKLASLGVPVILIYLGFLNAQEMADLGRPFHSKHDWERAVRTHGSGVVPDKIWNNDTLDIGGTPLRTIMRSAQIALPQLQKSGDIP